MKLREALLIGLELIDGGALILQTLLKRLRWRILKPQHVVFLFPARELFTKFRIVQKRQIVFKPLLLQFGRLVPNKTPAPGSLSEDSRLLPGRHQFELVGDMTSILHRPFRERMVRRQSANQKSTSHSID